MTSTFSKDTTQVVSFENMHTMDLLQYKIKVHILWEGHKIYKKYTGGRKVWVDWFLAGNQFWWLPWFPAKNHPTQTFLPPSIFFVNFVTFSEYVNFSFVLQKFHRVHSSGVFWICRCNWHKLHLHFQKKPLYGTFAVQK